MVLSPPAASAELWAGIQSRLLSRFCWHAAGNRVLIGFVLGISGWKIHWVWHGLMVGLIVTLSSSLVILPDITGFLMYTIAGKIYGFMIDFIATKIFERRFSKKKP